MSTWAEWREAAKTPFKEGERVRMEDGKAYKARVPGNLTDRINHEEPPRFRTQRWVGRLRAVS